MYFSVVTSAGNADTVPNTVLVESPTSESKVEKTVPELRSCRILDIGLSAHLSPAILLYLQLWLWWMADDSDDPQNAHKIPQA